MKIPVILESGIKIENYENILSNFSNWKEYKRQINLNLVLESGKKIQFDLEILNSSRVFYISVNCKESLRNACSVVKKLTFIIKKGNVIELEVEIETLSTHYGKIIEKIIKSGIELKLSQYLDSEGNVGNFYFDVV
jgi:hypothetical protein